MKTTINHQSAAFQNVPETALEGVQGGIMVIRDEQGNEIDCLGRLTPDGRWLPHAAFPTLEVNLPKLG